MLLSQKEERERRFTLALRAGIPVLVLISLVFFSTFYNSQHILTIKDGVLLGSLTFITIYFIYFLMNLSVQETIIDEISQSFNKKAFLKRLPEYQPTSIGCINIQNLQTLSENYSSEQIDDVLYSLTQKLHLCFRQQGFEKTLIGRQKSSEFLIAVKEEDKTHNLHLSLTKMIESNTTINAIEIEYQFVVISNSNNDYEKMIIQLKDLLLTQSMPETKEQEKKTQDAKALSLIEKDVIKSIQKNKLLLSFRPLLNTKSNTIDTYELAIKLQSIGNSPILPRVFLPIVNRLGLGRDYDFLLISHVINLLPLIDDNISFSFNLSPFSLRDKDFQNKVFRLLKDKKINPSRLIIQLYERKTHHDLSAYLKTLKAFRTQGLRICIDNFGSSNASMEYIKHFKFDMVQFDRDYVTNLNDMTTNAMLQSLIMMSQDLQVTTVAKWVDNDHQKNRLEQLGIDYIQGFGVSKPITETILINRYN